MELPLDEYDTFGGYVLGELCYVPDDGTQVSVLTPDLEIMVTSIKRSQSRRDYGAKTYCTRGTNLIRKMISH